MLCPLKVPGVLVALSILSTTLAFAQAMSSLTPVEQRMAEHVDANNPAGAAHGFAPLTRVADGQ